VRVGIAADHRGFDLKGQLMAALSSAGYEVIDFGPFQLANDDDYPDFVVPLARAVASRQVDRGIAVCGSGVGASVAANKVPGVRAALVLDIFSAHQGVEDDDMNVICFGSQVTGFALSWDLTQAFLTARFKDEERHSRRLAKLAALEEQRGEGSLPESLLKIRSFGRTAGSEASWKEQAALMQGDNFGPRIWSKDATLWKTDAESQAVIRNSLGWLHLPEKMGGNLPRLKDFLEEIRAAGFDHVVHMGMGGSSLAASVFQHSFPSTGEGLPVTVLDTNDATTIGRLDGQLSLEKTLFVVASKSGTTAETLAHRDYFYARVKEIKGEKAGDNFAAVTDPGTPLAKMAKERRYRRLFLNFPDIGGRYSALSYFGLLPAVLKGVDAHLLLDRSTQMAHSCGPGVPVDEHPALALSAFIGEMVHQGKDKMTLLVPPQLAAFGMWVEQLVAESTGKENRGILPVTGEAPAGPSFYGDDRFFIHMDFREQPDEGLQSAAIALSNAGHPVVTIELEDLYDLGREFFRWEMVIAGAGAILGINPFDQPNVQDSKDRTKRILAELERTGKLPQVKPAARHDSLTIYGVESASTSQSFFRDFFSQVRSGDYVGLLAYLPETAEIESALQSIRLLLRDRLRTATTLGYGPRYLHSTGQYHKGGPNTGLFIQLIAHEAVDVRIPGAGYGFGDFQRAEAMGDFEALRLRGRRIVGVHLGSEMMRGLSELARLLEAAA
jgi:transaldolase/glucose-6-phosphate isomerase